MTGLDRPISIANYRTPPGQAVRVHQTDVLRILPIEAGFWKRLEGSVDFGLSFTSGNEQYQTELGVAATYRKGDHSYSASMDSAFSGQPQGESTRRNQFTFDYRKQLRSRYFAGGLLDLLHSDQQSLSLRTSVGGLLGRSLKLTERTRFSAYGGMAITRENYSAFLGQPRAVNAEALAGFDFASFRFSKTEIRSRFTLFPSLTTRWCSPTRARRC
jgi:hypothetical protein